MSNLLRNIRLKTISYALIVFMLTAGVIVGIASYTTLERASGVSLIWNQFTQGAVRKMTALSDLRHAIGYGGLIHNFKNLVLRGDLQYLELIRGDHLAAQAALADYRSLQIDATEAAALASIDQTIAAYVGFLPRIETLLSQGALPTRIDAVVAIDDEPALAAIRTLFAEIQTQRESVGLKVDEQVASATASTFLTLFVVGTLIVILIAVLFWFAQIRLVRPIYSLIEFVNRIGSGDLTRQMAGLSTDEVGTLGARINEMATNLKEITVQTREAVNNLNSAAAETLASTRQQASSVEEQFAALQQTTATLDEIAQSGQQMTGRAREIASQAEQASESSRKGLRAMDDLSLVMDAIEQQTESVAEHIVALSEKTQAISDIISTVNDIAERSQLLALNAAIEAATAGEQGRSFAVVAEEIKTLADQAKQATTRVTSILGEIQKGINSSVMSTEESVKRVANGRDQAEGTLKSITELAETIEASVSAFEQIVASTNQQRVGLEQVTEALSQIRTGSEQTAAGTRQIEQAVTNINALGSQLGHTMERYAV